MMQPPRQIVASVPGSTSQPYSSDAARICSNPCAYATTFEAYSASRTASTNSGPAVPPLGPASVRDALTRWSLRADSARAKTASVMAVSGTPSSSADCAVQRPVPFCSALSRITSTSGLPVSGVLWAEHVAVISMR